MVKLSLNLYKILYCALIYKQLLILFRNGHLPNAIGIVDFFSDFHLFILI